jgi:hypothetical protein
MTFTVVEISTFPPRFVLSVLSERCAQLIARALGERDARPCLSYVSGGAFGLPDASVELRAAARDPALHDAIRLEIADEAPNNPLALQKWLIFRFSEGKTAYLEHDVATVRKCRADPTLIDVTEIFARSPSGALMRELWQSTPRPGEVA